MSRNTRPIPYFSALLATAITMLMASAAAAQWTLRTTSAPIATQSTGYASDSGTTNTSWGASWTQPGLYFDPYEGCADDATVESLQFATPDPDDLLLQADEPWAAGGVLWIDLVVSRCARVASFEYGGIEIWGHQGGIDSPSYSAHLVSTTTATNTSTLRIELRHPTVGTGLRQEIRVGLEQPKTGAAGNRSFPVNWVSEVGGGTEITILEEEVRNSMLASIYASFGDDARAPIDDEGSWFIRDPALRACAAWDLDDDDCLRVEIVENEGIRFSMAMKMAIDNFCDPDIVASGTIAYERNGTGFAPVWVDDLSVDIEIPALCKLLTGIVIPIIAQEVAEEFVVDRVKAQIEPMLDQSPDCGLGCSYANDPLYLDGEMVVPIDFDFAHVTIDVPYRGRNPDHTHWGANLFMAEGEPVLLIGSGSARLCGGQSESYQHCDPTHPVGVSGLENFRSSVPSVPDPWWLGNQQWVHNAFRQALRDEMVLPDRFLEELPAPFEPVGALLTKSLGSSRIRSVTSPCRVPAPSQPRFLGFSPNERSDRVLGTGSQQVTMVFLDQLGAIADGIPVCPFAGELVPLVQQTGSETSLAAETLAEF